ncbi:40S ribosomal protein S27a, putative [Cryptosporidium muris RN66]|uniref:40S ribosomal protein S27a, putative n=1 Tax=Cryptosporidium muris (strain RN66) TaxID=441375 RepID=B6AD59_CRYMR|nr:40S ribosomal protein S27a, putative [Cryptosporidium muris RN66]EEA06063.1 40S ribosomal protein S27a, putative [Cryptosporidium muris RN66]|eukprot:XP_002140412.1 40S ribosomal protein S27a [Cryptosporidium muris RN66]
MQIFLNCGLSGTQLVSVDSRTSIADLKLRIYEVTGIPTDLQQLNFGFISSLNDDELILESGLTNLSTVFVTMPLLGGAKKKKKNFAKPKKIKHKKKKVKLAVLKYYKVDGNKVVKLRRECPAETCGAGVFMAQHFNRITCGRCSLTYFPTKGDNLAN